MFMYIHIRRLGTWHSARQIQERHFTALFSVPVGIIRKRSFEEKSFLALETTLGT